MKRLGITAALLFVGTVIAANWAIQHVGTSSVAGTHFIPVWPGIIAPSGVLFVGLAFTLRDIVHRSLGRFAVIAAIVVGAAVSYWISSGVSIPGGHASLAVASGIAFLLSELADLTIYEPLSRKTLIGSVAASNLAGTLVDSALFLWLAFGSLSHIDGQIIGKSWMTLAALPVVFTLRRSLAPAR